MRALCWIFPLLGACSSAAPPAREFLNDRSLHQTHHTFVVWQRCGENGQAWGSAVVSREGRLDAEVPAVDLHEGMLGLVQGRKSMRCESRSTTLEAEEMARLKNLVSTIPGRGHEESRPPVEGEGGGVDRERRSWPHIEVSLLVSDAAGESRRFILYLKSTQPPTSEKHPQAEVLAVDEFFRETLKARFMR